MALRLLLIDTSTPGARGSMARHANLVEQSLSTIPLEEELEVERIRLSSGVHRLAWLPASIRTWLNHAWLMLTAGRRIKKARPDLVHLLDGSFAYLLERFNGLKTVVTVHDLIPMLHMDGTLPHGSVSAPARWLVKRTMTNLPFATRLIADSRNTLADMVRLAGCDDSRATVISPALDPGVFEVAAHGEPDGGVASRDGVPMVLHLGHNGPYKNRSGVIRVFARIRIEVECRLIMAGSAPTKELNELVRRHDLGDSVEFRVGPDDIELASLYQEASLLLFPSHYEGFGWPPLEAMAFGCPVVCSDAGSLGEVVGDAALIGPPEEEERLAQLSIAVLSDPELARKLQSRGRDRAAAFSIDRMGGALMAVYREALSDELPSPCHGVHQ